MAIVYPDFMTISKLRTPSTEGEHFLLDYLSANLDSSYEVFFNPYLDGDRPDVIILKQHHCAIIIEVKDWVLPLYSIDENNKWSVYTKKGKLQHIRSPHQQAFQYKTNMFELHLPVLGTARALNSNFYKVIRPFVYFHNNKLCDLHSLFAQSLDKLYFQKSELNEQRKHDHIEHEAYIKRSEFLESKIAKIERDKAISFSTDSLNKLFKKINNLKKDILFSNDIYEDFKRRLSPPEHVKLQGEPIKFDVEQQQYTNSVDELSKIKGVAGCGKTSIIAARAISAYLRHGRVLILTYNITLKQLIRDKISHINHHSKSNIDINEIEIANYHSFFMAQLNELNKYIDIPDFIDESKSKSFWDKKFKDASYFKDETTVRYGSIFIDEIQDYEKEWITIIRDHFLKEQGEMILFGDQSQNIYQRDEDPLNKSLVRGFGRWGKLTKSYRSSIKGPLVTSFKRFQEIFLTKRHEDLEIFESKQLQGDMKLDLLVAYHFYDSSKIDEISHKINDYIKMYSLIPNNITIIASHINILNHINDFFIKQEKTKTTFVTNKEKEKCKQDRLSSVEKLKSAKKHFFEQNSGLIKFSTIQSFKGMESETVFCIFNGHEEPEVIYTAITRAKKNLVIFDKQDSIYANFFINEYK